MQGKKSDLQSESYNEELKNRLLNYKLIDNNGCWIWKKCTNQQGYGIIRARRKNLLAHRLSYELFKKENPGEKEVCHMCDIPICINPEHLFLGTHSENMKDALRKKRHPREENHYNAKLNTEMVKSIKNLLRNKLSLRKIAKLYNVSASAINSISLNRSWKSVEI